eukprot:2793432-Rhodomonas_salina.1
MGKKKEEEEEKKQGGGGGGERAERRKPSSGAAQHQGPQQRAMLQWRGTITWILLWITWTWRRFRRCRRWGSSGGCACVR